MDDNRTAEVPLGRTGDRPTGTQRDQRRSRFAAMCTKTRIARSAPKSHPGDFPCVAVVKGFEPLEGLHPHTLSRRAP